MEKNTIKIDIVSDIACPWCYVGKKILEAAIKTGKGAPIEVNWHPFQLDPNLPLEGVNMQTYLNNKFGGEEKVNEIVGHLTQTGKEVDIAFHFDDKTRNFNTLQMHQLLNVASQEGFQNDLKARFLKAYFEENLALNEIAVLCKIMAEYDWTPEKVKSIITSDDIALNVKQEIAHYQQLGVSSVPFFIINNKYGISGAQPSQVFLDTFKTASPIEMVSEGPSCDPITGEC